MFATCLSCLEDLKEAEAEIRQVMETALRGVSGPRDPRERISALLEGLACFPTLLGSGREMKFCEDLCDLCRGRAGLLTHEGN